MLCKKFAAQQENIKVQASREIFGPGPGNGQSCGTFTLLRENISRKNAVLCSYAQFCVGLSLSLERGAVMRARHETSGILSRRGRLLVLFARNERTKITFPVWNHATKEWRDICVVARYL